MNVADLTTELFFWFVGTILAAFVKVWVRIRGGSKALSWSAAVGFWLAYATVGYAFGFSII